MRAWVMSLITETSELGLRRPVLGGFSSDRYWWVGGRIVDSRVPRTWRESDGKLRHQVVAYSCSMSKCRAIEIGVKTTTKFRQQKARDTGVLGLLDFKRCEIEPARRLKFLRCFSN
jgi:hypothetical protein